jgi:predicted anti-sigma-YlaC factor YlaD
MVIAAQGDKLPLWLMEGLFVLLSIGIGTVLPLSTIAIQNTVERHQLGIATAAMNFFRSLGGALIVAVFGTIVLGSMMGGDLGAGHDIETLMHGANARLLASAFRWVFLAASVGLLLERVPITLDRRHRIRQR